VVKVIKEKENIVRHTVKKKKCVIIFGVKEKMLPMRPTREKEEMKVVREILKAVQEENSDQNEEIEVYRLGQYEEGGVRHMKGKFRSQITVSKILPRAWKLAQKEENKKIWIRRDMNEKERAKLSELYKETKEKNELKTEVEKKFYWRVKDQIEKMVHERERGRKNSLKERENGWKVTY